MTRIRKKVFNDLGFGNQVGTVSKRLLDQDGEFTVKRKGLSYLEKFSLFHFLINVSFGWFFIIILLGYLAMNAAFALCYTIIGIENLSIPAQDNFFQNFLEAFFFSTQTFTTVGYGRLNPTNISINIIASIESMMGLLAFAIATGLLYGRFAKPKAHLLFSKNALIAPYKSDQRALMFRLANKLDELLIDINATVVAAYIDSKIDSKQRQFVPLALERDSIYFLPTTWTVVHPLDENSPFFNWTMADFENNKVELLVIIKGYDENFAQQVHIRFSYIYQEFIDNAKFEAIQNFTATGDAIVSLDKLSNYILQE